MRGLAIIPVLMLAACSGGAENKAEPEAAARLDPGQWTSNVEVTELTANDGAPAIDTPAGTKSTANVCVGPDQGERPPTELFSGPDYACEYTNLYLRRGRINGTLNCTREGVTGEIVMSASGTYTATTVEAQTNISTYLPGSGDVTVNANVNARRAAAACAPAEKEG